MSLCLLLASEPNLLPGMALVAAAFCGSYPLVGVLDRYRNRRYRRRYHRHRPAPWILLPTESARSAGQGPMGPWSERANTATWVPVPKLPQVYAGPLYVIHSFGRPCGRAA